MLQKVQCWDATDILIRCNETMSEDGLNSTIRVENITMAIASITELRKDPLYSQVKIFSMMISEHYPKKYIITRLECQIIFKIY